MTDSNRDLPIHARVRRRVVQGIGAGALLSSSLPSFAAEPIASGSSVLHKSPRLQTFALADVELQPGLFLSAQERDERYLLQLEPDRMLHNFRVNAGLKPKAAVYGGWESQEPWVEIRCHGHTLGHYLSACSLMFASTAKQAFKKRVDYIVAELSACQDAAKSGLICAFPDGGKQLELSAQGHDFAGVPWYTMHKVFAGLRDAHLDAHNPHALAVMRRLADWTADLIDPVSDQRMQKMLDREHGGMNEVLGDLYALTGEHRYLDLATKFTHRALLQPLVDGRDVLDGLHSNTQIPKAIGFQRLHELTGRDDYRNAADFFWRTILDNRTYATGGNGDIEHFFPPQEFVQRLQSAKTMETCCMHNMLRLTRALFVHEPDARYADYYERTLYNGILASQDPSSGMMTYFQATRPGYVKLFHTPIDSFWCCTGSGMENHAKYGDSIYFHDDDSLYVNLFIPSTLHWRAKGVRLTQSTRFPNERTTAFVLQLERPTSFSLRMRQPSWSRESEVSINGTKTVHRSPGEYLEFKRTWRSGDRIEMSHDLQLRFEPLPGNTTASNFAALLYGPIVLAGRMGTEGLSPGADIIVNERQSGEMLNRPREVPVWKIDRDSPNRQVKPTETRPLAFIADGVEGLSNIELIPYFEIAHERYNLYWKLT